MAQTATDVRGDTRLRTSETRTLKETRRAFQTTEFFVLLAAVAAVVIIGYASDDSLDAARIWTLHGPGVRLHGQPRDRQGR